MKMSTIFYSIHSLSEHFIITVNYLSIIKVKRRASQKKGEKKWVRVWELSKHNESITEKAYAWNLSFGPWGLSLHNGGGGGFLYFPFIFALSFCWPTVHPFEIKIFKCTMYSPLRLFSSSSEYVNVCSKIQIKMWEW